ncbi:mate-domain-containing protein [Ochromonadaceae sp. CCMP2298]|nr:mate-domain-containing protein [Ochromonadaceae sp. CCMP2298]
MFVSVSCLSLLIGMSSAVETLGSQHNGAGNYKEVGLVLQRSFAVLACMCVPILCLWAFVAPLYRLLGVEAAVCEVVRRYIFIRAFSVPLDVANESYEKYLMSIGVVAPSMWANIVFNLLVLSFNCLFCIHLRLPYDWLAVSWVLSSYLAFALMLLLSYQYAPVKRTLVPWDLRAFTRWGEFCSLGLPGTVMLCSEWWAFEFLTIFASLLGTANLAAQVRLSPPHINTLTH